MPEVFRSCPGITLSGMLARYHGISATNLEIDREASISIKKIKEMCLPVSG